MIKETFIYSISDYYALKDASWSGASDTLNEVEENEKEEELLDYLNSILENYENGLEETKLNDFLWFDRNHIYDEIGIDHD